jgi:hypothetical protein
MTLILAKYYVTDQIKKNEMGEARGMYGRKEMCIQGFSWETDHLEDMDMDVGILE